MTTVPTVAVEGFATGPFEPLADVFARMVAMQGTGGAALAVYHGGELVADLYGGSYRQDSLQLVFSVSKLITAIAAQMAHGSGKLDLDAPLGDYWPAFRRPETSAITLRLVMSHRSGLAATDRVLSFEEMLSGEDEEAVEVQQPYWEPGTRHGYHAYTFGTLVNGAFRRVLGETVGQYVAREIAEPLGLDLWIGMPESQLGRLEAIEYRPARLTPLREAWLRESPIPKGSTGRLAEQFDVFNSPRTALATWPSTSGVAGARDLARLLAAVTGTVDGRRLLTAHGLEAMRALQARGLDAVLGVDTSFGTGVQLPFPQFPLLGPGSFGHEAAGGSAAFADTDLDVAVGFTTNVHPTMPGASAEFLALLPTLRHCLAAPTTPTHA